MVVREGKASGTALRNDVFATAERKQSLLDKTGGGSFVHHTAQGFHVDAHRGYGFLLLLEKILEGIEP